MYRKIKALSLALVAALALTAVMASAASAQFTSTAAHTTLSGSQSTAHQFTAGTGIGAINCSTASFGGTIPSSEAVMTLFPTYAGCKDSLGRTVDITKNSLAYTFISGANKGLFYNEGEIIFTVTASFGHCTISFQNQQVNNGITYTNNTPSAGRVTLHTATNNIHSSISGGAFACGTKATSSTTGTYTGSTVLSGNGGAASISVD
jgi:hypothetical protein